MAAPEPAPDAPGPDHRAEVPNRIIVSPETRRYLYVIVVAVLALLGAYGILGPDESGPWLDLAGAVLGVSAAGLAAVNVPRE